MDSNPRFPGHGEFTCRALPQGPLRGIRAPERTLLQFGLCFGVQI